MLQTVLTALAVLLLQGVAFGQIVEFEGRYWLTDLTGSVQAKTGSSAGTNLDFHDDLGLTSANAPEARLTFFAGPFSRIRLAYTHLNFEGDKTLSRTITFDGSTFTANTRVSSDMEIHYGRIGWLFQPLVIPGVLKFGGLLEAKGFFIETSLRTRGVTPAVKQSVNLPIVLPTAGLALDVTPHPTLHLFAEASGLPAGGLGHLVDAEVGLRFVPIPFFSLSAGYRVFDIRAHVSNDFAALRLIGPFVGASVRF